jgi:protein-S-isoprenylcysteine O-methyltransferase Ste14
MRQIVAALLIAWWAVLVFWALIAFRRARTTVLPNRPANSLVTTGPYRYTRNPMYVSFAILYVAAALMMNTLWPFLVLPLVILTVDRLVIVREERYLSSAFPEEYYGYRRRVRRWL